MRDQTPRETRLNLHPIFNPLNVAVVGASQKEDKLGFHVMKSLTTGGFAGRIIPVNPGAKQVMGIPCIPSLNDFQGRIDLVLVVLPAGAVPQVFDECRRNEVGGIVLITAGYKEIDDPEGARRQEDLAEMALKARIPVIGPNTFGTVNLHNNLNASFTPEFSQVRKGGVSLVSQSGGISHLLAFMAIREDVGMAKIVGLGNRLNIDFPEMVKYLMEDDETKVIALYIEGLDDPKRLMLAVESCNRKKPVLAYKTGKASTGDQASLSHTGSIAGNQQIYESAFRQAGIFCLDTSEGFLDLAKALSGSPLPRGPRVAVLSGQAGPAMAACDVCEREGLEIVSFRPGTQALINEWLPPLALRSNPVDMGPAWYDSAALNRIVRAVMEDENVDAILLLMMFASANRGTVPGLSRMLLEWRQKKPVVTCLLAPPGIWDEQVRELERANALVNFPTPERAALVLTQLQHFHTFSSGPVREEIQSEG
jgi:acyl-CoA synthetase (NDP forming)